MRRVVALLTIGAALGLAGTAQATAKAAAVTPAAARAAIKADPFTAGTIDWTKVERFGVLARVSATECYTDPAFGASTMVTHTLVWVHRSHRQVVADPIGRETFDSYPSGCSD